MKKDDIAKNREKNPSGREDRLKAALKANLARRKAQSRAKASGKSENSPKQ